MSANTPAPGTPDSKEGLKNPSLVNIDDLESILGKGIGALHLRSGYGNKNIPTYFEYSPVNVDEALSEVWKYKDVEPRVFQYAHNAAEYIRNNSMFATDTYVLEFPGDIVIVYQFTIIREIFDSFLKQIGTGHNVKDIINLGYSPGGEQYDKHGIRKPEWIGVDDNGGRVDSLYIDTSSMNDRMSQLIMDIPLKKDFIETGLDHTMPTKKDFRDK